MSDSKIDKIKEKIKKLMALATAQNNVHESESALKKALALMEKHRLTEEDVSDKQEHMERHEVPAKRSLRTTQRNLVHRLAESLGVTAVRITSGKFKKANVFEFIGAKSDVAIAIYSIDATLNQIEDMRERYRKVAGYIIKDAKAANEYVDGLCIGLVQAMQAAKREAKAEAKKATGTGLMTVDTRLKDAIAMRDNMYDNLKNARRSKINYTEHTYQGIEDSEALNNRKGVTK